MLEKRRVKQIGIVMASGKDLPIMRRAAEVLQQLGIPFEMKVLSPFRSPDKVVEYAKNVRKGDNLLEVIIAGSGNANQLAMSLSAHTVIPIISVPLTNVEDGGVSQELGTVLSAHETPRGFPLASMGFNDAENAAILAAQILAVKDTRVHARIEAYRRKAIEEADVRAVDVEALADSLQPE